MKINLRRPPQTLLSLVQPPLEFLSFGILFGNATAAVVVGVPDGQRS
jgi:hypothetical protein